jgi:hemolysin III
MEPGASLASGLALVREPTETPNRANMAMLRPGSAFPTSGMALSENIVTFLPRQKPRWRGVSHQYAAFLAAPAVVLLWLSAEGFAARLGAAVYGLSLIALFAISAINHRPTWTPRMRDRVGRLDQAAIFLLIAGTYTPFGLLLRPGGGHTLLVIVWAIAACGVLLSLVWPEAPKPLMAGIYVLFGWVAAALIPSILRAAGPAVLTLILLGAIGYTVGAFVYALRRPDPFPRTFGYHEIFHLLVVVAAGCHFAAVSLALRTVG